MHVTRACTTALLAGLLAGPPWALACAPEGGQAIAPGATLERRIRGSECHRYVVASTLPLWVGVEERRVDLSVVLGDRSVESGVGREWMEAVLLEPDAGGQASFAVEAAGRSALSGGYRLTVTALDPADPASTPIREALELTARRDLGAAADAWQHAGRPREAAWMRLAQALAEIDAGRGESAVVLIEEAESVLAGAEHQAARTRLTILRAILMQGLGRHAEAAEPLERAIADGDRLEDPSLLANVHLAYGLVRHYRDSLDAARLEYQKAAELLARDPGPDPFVRGMLHNNLAGIHYVLGEPEPAFAEFQLAETIAREIGDDMNLADVLSNTAQLRANLGMYDRALVSFMEALEVFESRNQRGDVARTLRGIGSTYLGLGVFERAREFLELAIAGAEAAGDAGTAFSARLLLGDVYRHLGQLDLALAAHNHALADSEQGGRASNAARAAAALGKDALAFGRPEEALPWLESAVTTFRGHGYRRELADSLYALGTAQLSTGDTRDAGLAFGEAERLQRELGDDRGLVLTLTRRARLESAGDELARALATASEAAEVLERARGNVSNADLQASFFGSRLQPYDELVRLHLAIGERSGQRERAATAALASAERSRARALKDLLAHTQAAAPEGSETVHAELMAELNGHVLRLRDLQSELDSARDDEGRSAQIALDVDAAKSALRRVRFELDALDAGASAANALHAAVLAGPADLPAIRASLPGDLGVLAYYVGEEEATGWLLRRDSIRAFPLPPAAEIEAAAMEAYELASRWQPDAAPLHAALGRLASALLPELRDESGLKRLVIVPDGALHRVPFAALPIPADERTVLLDRFEITTAPAVSLVRPESAGWPPRGTRMAVFAAPVFEAERLAGRVRAPEPGETGLAAILSSLGPLPYSAEEARRIRERAERWTVDLFEGGDANKRALLSPETARYSVVHFATHAVVSSEFPELSGLVLSQVDADGKPVDGLLHLQEIYDLPLDADLVVLSACRTARGRDLRGEGPVSLGRAFLFAGARRVVTTQWNIPDDVTAELMAEFYAGMFERGLPPPAALREAQLRIAGEPASAQPFYWAGFTLTGTIVD